MEPYILMDGRNCSTVLSVRNYFFFAALLSSYSSFLLSLVPLLYGGLAFLFWRGFGIIVKAAEYYIADKEDNSYESEDEG